MNADRETAERVRRVLSGELLEVVYGVESWRPNIDKYLRDLVTLAAAYLTEHAAPESSGAACPVEVGYTM